MPSSSKAPAAALIPLSEPRIEGNALKYVAECLETQWVSSVGKYVGLFEERLQAFTGARFAVAGVNGTACLHLALELLGIGPGDAVIVPALTFIATANAVSYTGAAPVFVDCEPRRFNLDLDRLESYLKTRCAKRKGGLYTKDGGLRLRAVMPVHVLGYPLDMDALLALAARWGLEVVEDAAESIGSSWRGRHTGTFATLGVLSFNGNKIITTGGGGAILTDDAALAKRAKHLTQQAKADAFEYVHDEIGHNYRLTNMLAALGVAQLESLPGFLEKRKRIAGWYRAALPGVAVEPLAEGVQWNRWLLAVDTGGAAEKSRLLRALNAAGCQARPLWRPVPLQKPYARHPSGPIDHAKRAYAGVVNVPSSTALTEEQVQRVCAVLRQAKIERLLA